MASWKTLFSILAGSLALSPALASAAALTKGNLLVTTNSHLHEITPQGVSVQSFDVPSGPFSTLTRDLVVSADGKVHVFQDDSSLSLQTLNPATGSWSAKIYAGWSVDNNGSFGGIAAFDQYVFVTDMAMGGDEETGIIRFDLTGGETTRFANKDETIDLTIGLDGLLYSLDLTESTVGVYHPSTLEFVRSIYLQENCRGIAVNAAGHIFGADWSNSLHHFDKDGVSIASLQVTVNSPTDIDVDADGHIVASGRFGQLVVTDESFASPTYFEPLEPDAFQTISFVGFVTPGTPAIFVSGSGEGGSAPEDSGDCGCSVPGGQDAGTSAALLSLLGLLAVRGRRRTRSRLA